VSAVPDEPMRKLQRIQRLCQKEAAGLERVAARLFAVPVTGQRLAALDTDDALSERIDAFAARFSRLQDAITDKLLPAYFELVQEPPRPVLEMLDRAERLGLIGSADAFLAARKLRNRLVHEYVEDRDELAANLGVAHSFIPQLTFALDSVAQAIARLQQRVPE